MEDSTVATGDRRCCLTVQTVAVASFFQFRDSDQRTTSRASNSTLWPRRDWVRFVKSQVRLIARTHDAPTTLAFAHRTLGSFFSNADIWAHGGVRSTHPLCYDRLCRREFWALFQPGSPPLVFQEKHSPPWPESPFCSMFLSGRARHAISQD